MRYLKTLAFGLLLSSVAQTALAIPPPDLIMSGMQSMLQVFGVAAAFLISSFFLLKDTFKLWWQLHRKWMLWGLSFFLIGSLMFGLWITHVIF